MEDSDSDLEYLIRDEADLFKAYTQKKKRACKTPRQSHKKPGMNFNYIKCTTFESNAY